MKRIHKGKYYYDFQRVIENMLQGTPKCFICGSTKNVGPHHLRKVKRNNPAYADRDNIVLLCRHHHSKYHNKFGNKEINPKTFAVFLRDELNHELHKMDIQVRTERNKVKRLERELESLRDWQCLYTSLS